MFNFYIKKSLFLENSENVITKNVISAFTKNPLHKKNE
jgi:hypothetical protein